MNVSFDDGAPYGLVPVRVSGKGDVLMWEAQGELYAPQPIPCDFMIQRMLDVSCPIDDEDEYGYRTYEFQACDGTFSFVARKRDGKWQVVSFGELS